MPLPPAITAKSSWASATPLAGQHPQRAAGEQQDRGRDAAEAALDPGREDRQAERDDEQVADVDVGEGSGEEAPPLVLERDHQAAEAGERVAAGLLDQQQQRAEPRITARVA